MNIIRKYTNNIVRYIVFAFIFVAGTNNIYAYGYKKTAEEYDKEIKVLYQNNKMDSIKIILEEALQLYPNDTDINRWAGTYFLHKKETDNARYYLIKAVQEDSDNFLAKQQLVSLEEQLGNLSSAICYVNEMLELYPYDKTLWKKKIGLYRKQGNDIEADRLIKRMYSIYHNDSTVRNDYINRMEEVYMQQRKNGNRDEAISTLKGLIELKKHEKSYYLDLGNLLLQEGHSEEAVAIISKGLEYFPDDNDLLKKKAEIIAERGFSKEAVGILQKSKHVLLYPVANEIMIEAARSESWKDPYNLYGRIYESRKSDEALDYLTRTSISRGYYNDALFYLSENRKRYGNSSELLYKEYMVYKSMGDEKSAIKKLELYVETNKNDNEMADELALIKSDIASGMMGNNMYQEAIAYLEYAMRIAYDNDIRYSAIKKLSECYIKTNKNEKAIFLIDSVRYVRNNNSLLFEQKATALHNLNQSEKALSEMESANSINSELYDRISSEYIKELIEIGDTKKAYTISKRWTEKVPESKSGLMYAINTSDAIKKYDETEAYIAEGINIYPDEPFFVIKKAAVMFRKKEYQAGIDYLKPWIYSYPGNKNLISAYSAHSEMMAQNLLKYRKTDEALSVIENAISVDNDNQELFLLEGQVYEMKGDYNAAYNSYSKYKPETLWVKEYKRKLMNVQNKGYRNIISIDMLNGWYTDGKRPNSIATASYSRKMKRDYITSTVNISCKNKKNDADISGDEEYTVGSNTGAQVRVDWGHTYNDKWSSILSVAAANAIFPTWIGQAGIFYLFPKDVETGITIGYRKNYTPANAILNKNIKSDNMYNIRFSGNVYREIWRINTNLDAFLLNKNMYFNLNSKFRYYPNNDNNTHFMLSAGLGTAPEIDFVDKLMPGSFDNINVSLGIGGIYMLSKNISIGMSAYYHYFYNQKEKNNDNIKIVTNYKNLYDLYAHIIFSF